MKRNLTFLGIETSCDETAASIVRETDDGLGEILSNIVSSQVEVHKEFGGVVPDLAARAHVEKIDWIINKAINKSKINNIRAGNIEENFDLVKTADWVVEAVVEKIDIKHNLYEKILKIRKKDSIISSNTSTIPLKVLSAKMSEEDKKDFCITHFFNPVRYMGLLEIVSETTNDIKKINFLKNFCEDSLGKGVIICKDTPGFLGNRVGVYAMQVAMTEAIKMKLIYLKNQSIFQEQKIMLL